MSSGRRTRQLQEDLCDKYQGRPDVSIYWDPHKSDGTEKSGKCRPTAYYGTKCKENRVSYIDIIITKDNEVSIICEIEESGADPKKIAGDIVSLLIAEDVSVRKNQHDMKGKQLKLNDYFFILGVNASEDIADSDRLDEIGTRILQIIQPIIRDGRKFDFIIADNCDELMDKVEKRIDKILKLK